MNPIRPYISFMGETADQIMDRNIDQLFESVNDFGDTVDDLGTFEIAAYGALNIDLTFNRTNTVLHNLGYPPLFSVYLFNSAGNWYSPLPLLDYGFNLTPNPQPASNVSAWTDSLNLNINWTGTAPSPNQSFYYFIYKNPAA